MAIYTEFVNTLSSLTGLHTDVLNAWVAREQGVNNNILGITSGGQLVKYPSQTAAAVATASLIQGSSQYAGIRTSEQGTSAQQALAIAKSPWHLGASGLAAVGGVDPYYYKGFVQAGILSGSVPSGGASTPITPTGYSGPTLQSALGHAVTLSNPTDVKNTVTELLSKYPNLTTVSGGMSSGELYSYLIDFIGHPSSSIPLNIPGVSGYDSTLNTDKSATSGILNFDIPGALMFVGVLLVGITFLILGGIVTLRKPK